MKLFAYKGKVPNFGDELNFWLWDRLLPDFFDEDGSEIFLGIGSVLHERFGADVKKVVFGSGYGGYGAVPKPDSTWKIYFVRGKETAKVLGVAPSLGIGDAGILVRSCWDPAAFPKRYEVSFMPHFESAMYGNWEAVCRKASVHFLDPRLPVEQVLQEMSQSRLVISEAMHGAIIADALRVPWRAIRPLEPANREKWQDWASALDVQIEFSNLHPSNLAEMLGGMLRWNEGLRKNVVFRHRALDQITGQFIFPQAAQCLRVASQQRGQLSGEENIVSAHKRMLEQLELLKDDFGKRVNNG